MIVRGRRHFGAYVMCQVVSLQGMAIIFEIIGHVLFGVLLSDESPPFAKTLALGILAALCLALVAFVVWIKTQLAYV